MSTVSIKVQEESSTYSSSDESAPSTSSEKDRLDKSATTNDLPINQSAFPLGAGSVKVLSEDDRIPHSSAYYFDKSQAVHLVQFGSSRHLLALKERLIELLSLPQEKNGEEIRMVKEDIYAVESHLQASSCKVSDEKVLNGDPSKPHRLRHVTSETFGEISDVKTINSHTHQTAFRHPVIRQYYIGNVFHREEEERKTTWDELFVDLIYVGAISKTAHHLRSHPDWDGFQAFCLTFLAVVQHWRAFAYYVNIVLHRDLLFKLCSLTVMTGVIIMALTSEHTFSKNPNTNTSNIFLGAYLMSRSVFLLLWAWVWVVEKKLRPHLFGQVLWYGLALLPLISLVCLPYDGTQNRMYVRAVLWWITMAGEVIVGVIITLFLVKLSPKNKFALNIEHMTERNGLLIVIVFGEVIVGLLYDHTSSGLSTNMTWAVVGLIIGSNLAFIYFRTELSSHVMHAIRRSYATSMGWGITHIFLSLSIAGLGSSMATLIQAEVASSLSLTTQLQQIFFTMLAGVIVCMVLMVFYHQNHDHNGIHGSNSKAKAKRNSGYVVAGHHFSREDVIRGAVGLIAIIVCLVLGFGVGLLSPRSMLLSALFISIFSSVLDYVRSSKRHHL